MLQGLIGWHREPTIGKHRRLQPRDMFHQPASNMGARIPRGVSRRTVEGWEQGRPIDSVANIYLHAISTNPDVIGRALEQPIT